MKYPDFNFNKKQATSDCKCLLVCFGAPLVSKRPKKAESRVFLMKNSTMCSLS